MRTNKISAEITPEGKALILANIEEIKTLMPYLINLSVEERKTLKSIGDKNMTFVQKCLEAALANPSELKANFDILEYQRDVNLFNNLIAIKIACQSLLELVDDSMKAAGIDAMKSSFEVYDALKASAKNNANVKAIVDDIAIRFKGQGKLKNK
jgi:hypothetical protein